MKYQRYALQIAYDGSSYYGWQKQYISPTVQEVLEKALSHIAKEQVLVTGSGRTDSGVHASCQIAHFDFGINMRPEQIKLAIKSKIERSIEIINVWEVDSEFHARYSAQSRTYHYLINKGISPFHRNYRAFLYNYKINTDHIQKVLNYIIGSHDFTSFCKPNPEISNHVCDIQKISFEEREEYWILKITANRFLHNMVRRIVGALVSISHKQQDPSIIKQWIEDQRHEQRNFFTAPACGLYLYEIEYPRDVFPYEITRMNLE